MAKVTLNNVGSILTSANTINNNNQRIEDAIENTLSRDGTEPNEMNADLDMNNNRVYNLPEPVGDTEPARKKDIDDVIAAAAEGVVATQAEAVSGVNNTKTMTPLRSKQQIDARLADDTTLDTDDEKLSTPSDVISRAERGDFTPQSPFIATRALGEKIGEVISIRDLGAPTMSGGQPDYTSVLANQEANLAYKTIEINEPIIRLTGLALTANNICLKGKGWTQTVIYNPDNTDTLTLSDCSFPEVVSLSLQHAPGATSGRGLVCTGSTSSGRFTDLFVANNPSGGIHCLGSPGVQQSANRIEGCLFTDNGEEQLFLDWCNDTRVLNNDFGRFAFAGYPKRGVKFSNSSQGTYSGNKHWNNIIAAEFANCNGMRIAVNRFEESRNEGVIISGGYDNTFLGNHVHTNSQSATGTYSAVRLAGAGRVSLIANKMYSWDAATYKHKHGIESDNSCAIDELLGNDCVDNVSAAINTNSAFVVSRAMNAGDDVVLRANGLGANVSEVYLDLNNPNVSDYASQRVLLRVAGAPRVAFNSQRYGSGAGGQFILEVADAAGVLQNRIIVDQFGQIFLPGLPTSPGAAGSLWKDGSGFVKVA